MIQLLQNQQNHSTIQESSTSWSLIGLTILSVGLNEQNVSLEHKKALISLERGIKIHPMNSKAWIYLGIGLLSQCIITLRCLELESFEKYIKSLDLVIKQSKIVLEKDLQVSISLKKHLLDFLNDLQEYYDYLKQRFLNLNDPEKSATFLKQEKQEKETQKHTLLSLWQLVKGHYEQGNIKEMNTITNQIQELYPNQLERISFFQHLFWYKRGQQDKADKLPLSPYYTTIKESLESP